MPDPLISIIIPNWNGLRFLETCLNALAAQTYAQTEVIIVDNASSDGSQAFIREHYDWVRLVDLPENRGFTGACNAGIKAATGEIIALLNNDTEVDPKWAEAVVDAFRRYPDVGLVASKMLLFDQRDTLHTAGDGFTSDGRPYNRGVWQKDTGQYHEGYVFSACGGSSAYRRVMLDEIGLLDDDLFFSLEDIDLGWRAQLQGWHALYTPHAIVYHHLSATGGGVTASYYDGRNLLHILGKNLPRPLWRKYGAAIVRRQLGQMWGALKAWRGAAARARLRGMLRGVLDVPRILQKRRIVQARRRVSIDYIDSILTADTATPAAHPGSELS